MATPRRLETNESSTITVVRFKDQKIIDPEAIQELGQELFDLIEKEDRRKIVLNFSRVEFLSSAALGKLVVLRKKVEGVKGKEQAAQQEESAKSSGGLAGRFMRKVAKKDDGEAAGSRSMIFTSEHEVQELQTTVSASDLAIPEGFKEKK